MRCLSKVLLLCGIIVGSNVAAAQSFSYADTTLLFEPERDGYTMFHVPAITISEKGTVLAFAEARYGKGSDYDEIDVVMRRSTNGINWEPLKVVIPFTKGKPTGNVVPIADRNGTIHLIYQIQYANVFYRQSSDEGQTWSTPVNITHAFDEFKKDYDWKVVAPGPGHGIQLKNGRLILPAWLCIPNPAIPGGNHRPSCVATIYSDDHGKTWKRGAIVMDHGDVAVNGEVVVNPNESMLVELTDGSVLLNARNESLPNRRVMSRSSDGISNWSKPFFNQDLFEPVCMASMARLTGNESSKTRLLFLNPDSRNNPILIRPQQPVYRPRENVTLRISYDEGLTWPVQKSLYSGGSGYSDMAVDKNGLIYALYQIREGDDSNWKYRVLVQRFNLEWATDGKDNLKQK